MLDQSPLKERIIKLKATMEMIVELNKKELEADNNFMPKMFIVVENQGAGLPMPFQNREEKDRMFFTMNAMLKKNKPDIAIFTSDSWYVKRKDNETRDLHNILPSEEPDRQEAMMVIGATDGASFIHMIPYDRDKDNNIVLGDGERMSDGSLSESKIFDGVFAPAMPQKGDTIH